MFEPSCGQLGHTKGSRKCPFWDVRDEEQAANEELIPANEREAYRDGTVKQKHSGGVLKINSMPAGPPQTQAVCWVLSSTRACSSRVPSQSPRAPSST